MWPPRQAPQVGVLKAQPASMSACMVPSAMASRHTCCVPGRMMQRTSACTFLPRRIAAAWRRSSMRPLVQLPITTWSMVTSARSAAGAALLGRCGLLTVERHGRGVDLEDARVLGVGVAGEDLAGRARAAAFGPGLQVLRRLLVEADDAVLAAGLDGHVAHREALVDGQRVDGLAGELHGLVEGAVDADQADGVQHQVLAGDPRLRAARVDELDALGHAQPDAAPGHGGGEVGAAHAGAEGGHGAVGAGVAVGADDDVARRHHAHVGQEHVLDAHAPHLEVVDDLVLAGELAHLLGLARRLDVLVRREVVGHQGDAGRVEDLREPGLLELVDRQRGGDVVGQREVDLRLDDVAGMHLVAPRGASEDLLGDRGTHQTSPAAAALLTALT